MRSQTVIIVMAVVVLVVLLAVGGYYAYLWISRNTITQDTTTDVPADDAQTDVDMGYQEKDYRGTNTVWGIRNNNPGNLRPGDAWRGLDPAQPSDGGYNRYLSMKWGIRAALINLSNEIKTYGSIAGYMPHYAPGDDGNDPNGYLNTVLAKTGFAGTDGSSLLNADDLIKLAWAHFEVENGPSIRDYIGDDDMEAAVALTPYKRTFLG